MTATHKNRLVTTVSAVASAGLGAFTVDAASSGYRTFGAGDDGLAFDGITITEGTAWERRDGCVYTHSGTSLARGTLMDSSTGSAITFTSAAIVTQGGSAELANKAEMLLDVFGATEISVTGAVTATIGRMHHCTGTSADYTVTLPAASGNAGKLIGFRMGSTTALTKLITIDGNASETIDGATTRIMWATETAILMCDGSNWHKIAGKSVPMQAAMYKAADQSGVVSAVLTKVNVDTDSGSATAAMVDPTNKRVNILRPGLYVLSGYGRIGPLSANSNRTLAETHANGSQVCSTEGYGASGGYPGFLAQTPRVCAVSDYIEIKVYHQAGSDQTALGGAPTGGGTTVGALEVPQW